MSGEKTPTRKRGRPPKAPEDLSHRPTVAFRVSPELHALIVTAAEKNGRSLAQEMERCIQDTLSMNPNELVVQALKIEEQKNIDFFNGDDGFYWAKNSADLYRRAVQESIAESGWDTVGDPPKAFVDAFLGKMQEGQRVFVEEWVEHRKLATALKAVGPEKVAALFREVAKVPAVQEKLERIRKRRAERSASDKRGIES